MQKLMTPEDVGELLGVPPRTLAWWRHQHSGPPYVAVGRHVRYRAVDLEAWLESHARDPQPAA